MSSQKAPLIFDGHNDVLLKLYNAGGVAGVDRFIAGGDGAVDVPSARAGGFGGGFFAVYVPSPVDLDEKFEEMTKASYDLPLPEPIGWEPAARVVLEQAAILFALEARGALVVCRSAADMRAAFDAGKMAAIFHIEGAEAIDADLHMLEVLFLCDLLAIIFIYTLSEIFNS